MQNVIKNSKLSEQALARVVVTELVAGKVVLLAFDTSYGLAADATNQTAVNKVYQIKDRDRAKPLSIVVADLVMAKEYCQIDKTSEKYFNKYFPGYFTLIFKTRPESPKLFTSKDSTQAIRLPDNQLLLDISRQLGGPFTATSANLSGQASCYSVKDFLKQIGSRRELVDLKVDSGLLPERAGSKIIDLTTGQAKILRD